jgi:hypothetical protein
MTDKQMAEKKLEFQGILLDGRIVLELEDKTMGLEKGVYIHLSGLENDLWQWVEKLVEEVEKEAFKKGFKLGEEGELPN